jgi:hypothetical protein
MLIRRTQFLTYHDKRDEARRSMAALAGKGVGVDDATIISEEIIIYEALTMEQSQRSSWTACFVRGEANNLKRVRTLSSLPRAPLIAEQTLLTCAMHIMSQFTGSASFAESEVASSP